MYCPFCGAHETKVTDSRLVAGGCQVRRRRECLECRERFTTYESAELILPDVIKRDGRRVTFSEAKLRSGIRRSLEKRPVSIEQIETLIAAVVKMVKATGEREISSQRIGGYVMQLLKEVDEVAYVRFASVYKRFQDIQAFSDTIDGLVKDNPTGQDEHD